MSYVTFENVTKIYKTGSQEIYANKDVNFNIGKGEFCVIVGPSGAGKALGSGRWRENQPACPL